MSRYKYDAGYTKYYSLSLHREFDKVRDYLLYDNEHANEEVFDAFDEIYHWFCVKRNEVEELLQETASVGVNLSKDPYFSLIKQASSAVYKTRPERLAVEVAKKLAKIGVNDIDSLMALNILDLNQKIPDAQSRAIAIIAAAQSIYANQNSSGDEE